MYYWFSSDTLFRFTSKCHSLDSSPGSVIQTLIEVYPNVPFGLMLLFERTMDQWCDFTGLYTQGLPCLYRSQTGERRPGDDRREWTSKKQPSMPHADGLGRDEYQPTV